MFGDLVFFQLSLLIDRLGIQIFSTSTVQLVTIPAITPRAASQGAGAKVTSAPVATQVTGIDKSTLPFSSLMTTLLTLESRIISLTLPTSPSAETW